MKADDPAGRARHMAARAREWTLAMTRRPSVTGTRGEAEFGPWLAERLRAHAAFRERARVWTIPVEAGDPRMCVAMLVRGSGRRTVILTGHYDTVTCEDYGDLKGLATEPEALAASLLERLREGAASAAELRARDDLASGDFLAGRGLLDMKAGLAAGLAAAEMFAAEPDPTGNVLFVAVPDEENASVGARRVAHDLPSIAAEHRLDVVAAINLDAIADDGDGAEGRTVALGTVGKLLPTAFVVGLPAHAAFPLNGINAAVVAAFIAAEVEWAEELTDGSAAQPGTPPSLLSIRDGKAGYDVTIPATAFATFNVLVHRKRPGEVLAAFEARCRAAQARFLRSLRERISRTGLSADPIAKLDRIPVLRFEEVKQAARARAAAPPTADASRADAVADGHSIPEQCRLATERIWEASGLSGPAIVIGFGSIPYLPTELSRAEPDAVALAAAARESAEVAARRHRTTVQCKAFFPAISDMSFFGEADAGAVEVIARNTPVWAQSIRWPETSGIAMVPTINAGPWGRDYHTPLERMHAPYAFDVLPGLLLDIVRKVLAGHVRTS